MEFIFVFYEWCFAILALILHSKIKDRGTFLISAGLTTMSVLFTIVTTAKYLHIENLLISKVVPTAMLFVPIMTISGFFLLVRNWDQIKRK